MLDAAPQEEVAHVLGIDIVAYSTKSIEAQVACVQALKTLLLQAIEGDPLVLDTGDGAVVVFGGSAAPALRAIEAVATSSPERGLNLRIGLHAGPVTRMTDVNGRTNAYGPGLNVAQRVMNAATPGGVLLSATAAEFARAHEGWGGRLVDLGSVTVKHGAQISVFGIRGFPGLDPAAKSRPTSQHNLPQTENVFVGRVHERQNLTTLLLDDRRRLVTLAGPGGIGKTSLALVTARALTSDFADGVWLVECDGLQTGDDVAARLASVLGPDAPPMEELQALLVLDCLERTKGVVPVVEDWLRTCPGLQVLATSRSLLTSKWETEFFIGPLSTRRGEADADAATLFANAARKVDPSFRVTRSNRHLVEAVVQSVQGVPLALVLAAGRLKYASLSELVEQLTGPKLRVLKRRSAETDKHADLNRVVADSFDLLEPPVRETMVALSVFAGGFCLADAEEVVGGGDATLDAVESLRDNSLVVGSLVAQKMRFRSLDVVAEYVAGLAGDVDLAPLHLRHSVHFAGLARAARARFDEGHWGAEAEAFWADLGNYRKAVAHAIDRGDGDALQDLARSLARIFMEAGLRSDFELVAQTAEALPGCDPALRLELQGLLGGVYRRDDDRAMAETYWLRRANVLAQTEDFAAQADAWADLACMALQYGDDQAASGYIARFQSVAVHLPPGPVMAIGAVATGVWHARSGRHEDARREAEIAEATLIEEPLGTRVLFGYAYLADLRLQLGEPERAVALCRRALPTAVKGKHLSYAGLMLVNLARGLHALGDPSAAARALAVSGRIPKSVSKLLKQKLNETRVEFLQSNQPELLRKAEGDAAGTAWPDGALAIVDASRFE